MAHGEVMQHHISSHLHKKLITGCSDGATKCPYVKDQGRSSLCERSSSHRDSSCCYTLWCTVEMWAALLIELLLASSLMSHCSFHDPLRKEVGCDVTPMVLFQDLNVAGSVIYHSKLNKHFCKCISLASLQQTNQDLLSPSWLMSCLLVQHNSTSLSHPPEDMDVLLNLA